MDRSVLPPLSLTYQVTLDPKAGWAALKKALASCPKGGSVLASAGDYIYGPGDLVTKEIEMVDYK